MFKEFLYGTSFEKKLNMDYAEMRCPNNQYKDATQGRSLKMNKGDLLEELKFGEIILQKLMINKNLV